MSEKKQKNQNEVDKEEVEVVEEVIGDSEGSEIGEQESQDNKISELESLIAELKDQSIRAVAEAENTRKRAEREISEAHKYGVTNLAKDLIDVLENLYRATEHFNSDQEVDESVQNMIQGVEMTQGLFLKALEKYGVKRLCPEEGEPFDHNMHQAVSQLDSEGNKPGEILKLVQAGYIVGDRLIRPAMVIVAK